jgi:glycosyltransferase involved in cell wall biosynthesis
MAILILDLSKHYGGADVRVYDLAHALRGRVAYQVAVLAESALHHKLVAADLPVLACPYGRGDLRLLPWLVRQLRQHHIRVLDAHNPQSQFWGALAAYLGGARLVATVHSAYRLEHGGSRKGRVYEGVLRLNAALGARFIAVTDAVYRYLQGIGLPRTHLIYNSLNMPAFERQGRQQALFQNLGWDASYWVLVCAARLEPVKGHRYLLEALAMLAPRYPRLRCLLLGDGRLRPALEAQIARLGLAERVHLAGFRDDVLSLVSACDAFCLPSLSEGLPYALLEAAGLGCPLIVSAVGGMAELLEHQKTAYLVPAEDAPTLAEGLAWLQDNAPAARAMAKAAHTLVTQKFDPRTMLEETLAIYGDE